MNKKLLSVLLVIALSLSFVLVSCGGNSAKAAELEKQAKEDHAEYVMDVTRHASETAVNSLNATRVLSNIIKSSKITLDLGDLTPEVITMVLSEDRGFLSVAGAEVFLDNDYITIDLSKTEFASDKSVRKIPVAKLLAAFENAFAELFTNNASQYEQSNDVINSLDEFMKLAENIKKEIEQLLNTSVKTEKVNAYGKDVSCIVSETVINNDILYKVFEKIFDFGKKYATMYTEEMLDQIDSDMIKQAVDTLGFVIDGKIRSEVDAESGLPVRNSFDFSFKMANPDTYMNSIQYEVYMYLSEMYRNGLGDCSISYVINYPENFSLLNDADATLTVTLNGSGSKMSSSVGIQWRVQNTDDKFIGKASLVLPEMLAGSGVDNIAFTVEYDRKTKDLKLDLMGRYALNLKLDYNEDYFKLTFVSYSVNNDDVSLGNVSVTVEKNTDFPKLPDNAVTVSDEEIDSLIELIKMYASSDMYNDYPY